ncbi:unnamed protein product [Amoebophrya sp. A120]|nr:unnamed protein product [Amoebophrya sp. A120]|eukprot:GSA120T00022716001.1
MTEEVVEYELLNPEFRASTQGSVLAGHGRPDGEEEGGDAVAAGVVGAGRRRSAADNTLDEESRAAAGTSAQAEADGNTIIEVSQDHPSAADDHTHEDVAKSEVPARMIVRPTSSASVHSETRRPDEPDSRSVVTVEEQRRLEKERKALRAERKKLEHERRLFEESRKRMQADRLDAELYRRQVDDDEMRSRTKIVEVVDSKLRDDDKQLREAAVVARLGLGALSNQEFADRSEREVRRKVQVKELTDLGTNVKDKLSKCWAELRIVEHDVKLEEEKNAISGLIAKELRDFKEDWRKKAREEEQASLRAQTLEQARLESAFPVFVVGDGDPVKLQRDNDGFLDEDERFLAASLPVVEEMKRVAPASGRSRADLLSKPDLSLSPVYQRANSAMKKQPDWEVDADEDDEIAWMYEKNVGRLARLDRLL